MYYIVPFVPMFSVPNPKMYLPFFYSIHSPVVSVVKMYPLARKSMSSDLDTPKGRVCFSETIML